MVKKKSKSRGDQEYKFGEIIDPNSTDEDIYINEGETLENPGDNLT